VSSGPRHRPSCAQCPHLVLRFSPGHPTPPHPTLPALLARPAPPRRPWPTLWPTRPSRRNVSAAYKRIRAAPSSKRVLAADVLANWVWPILSVGVGLWVALLVYRG
jgi:hypothetical protein